MDAADIEVTAEALCEREGVLERNSKKDIGRWVIGNPSSPNILDLPEWAKASEVDGVVWTALGHKFDDYTTPATADQIAAYLAGLTGRLREDAEHYVRRAPRQIDTPYRRIIEARLGWSLRRRSAAFAPRTDESEQLAALAHLAFLPFNSCFQTGHTGLPIALNF